MIEITTIGKQLIVFGIAFFLVGMVQGVLIPFVKNARMALSGHLTAVQCGMALAIFGVIWSLVDLPPALEMTAAYGSALGFVLIWVGITIASVTGASQALPIAGAGYSATPSAEHTVKILEVIGGLLSIIACMLLVFGLIPLLS